MLSVSFSLNALFCDVMMIHFKITRILRKSSLITQTYLANNKVFVRVQDQGLPAGRMTSMITKECEIVSDSWYHIQCKDYRWSPYSICQLEAMVRQDLTDFFYLKILLVHKSVLR